MGDRQARSSQRPVPGIAVPEIAHTESEVDAATLLVLPRLEVFLDAHQLGTGPSVATRIGEGQSNVTYLLQRSGLRFVLRRGPRPPLPPSTHDMLREARLLRGLQPTPVPVAPVLAVCEDETVLGVPFYIMRHVAGPVITSHTPAELDANPQRAQISELLIDTLISIHSIDPATVGLGDPARARGYLERQVARFTGLWRHNSTRALPAVAELSNWLARHLPTPGAATLLHGDYRLGNMILKPGSTPAIAAVLDWELASIGDPLADLGYLVATYAEPGRPPSPLELSPVTRGRGYLRRNDLVQRYAQGSGRSVDGLNWYEALALWKAAVFCEAIYTRWLRGERPDDTSFAPTLRDGVPTLLELASDAANRL